ncbi:MAG: hypothetical protein J6D23_03015 [Clostridia bacterium]|nr:hypothetical protein [Clostridia bacterium]
MVNRFNILYTNVTNLFIKTRKEICDYFGIKKLTNNEMENSINMLIDIEIARGKTEKLTDDNISEFLKSVTIY